MARILVADDEESVRSFVARALEHLGHSVDTVADGGAALQRVSEQHYDLVLTDIVMPVMDGIALALKLATVQPELKILLMTGYAKEQQRAHNLHEIIHDVLSKPFSLDELSNAVKSALDTAAP